MKGLLGGLLFGFAVVAQSAVIPLSDQVVVSDDTTTGSLGTITLDGLAAGPYVVRSRELIGQNDRQIVTFFQYDLSGYTIADTLHPGFNASFSIDFLDGLNTVPGNNLEILIGRNTNGPWNSGGAAYPLHDWGFEDGDGAPPSLAPADGITLVNNVLTDALGTITVDVTNIVANWINGTNPNHGFVLYYDANVFQGARFGNPSLDVVVPEPGTIATFVLLLPIGLYWCRKRKSRC